MTPDVRRIIREIYLESPETAATIAVADTMLADLARTSGVDHDILARAFAGLSLNVMTLLDSREGTAAMAATLALLTGSETSYLPTSH